MFVIKKILLTFFKFMMTAMVFFRAGLKTGLEKTEKIYEAGVRCTCHMQSEAGVGGGVIGPLC